MTSNQRNSNFRDPKRTHVHILKPNRSLSPPTKVPSVEQDGEMEDSDEAQFPFVSEEAIRVNDELVGKPLTIYWIPRAFGGLSVAQSLAAASKFVDESKPVHSFHAYYVQPASHTDVQYNVDVIRNSRSFVNCYVTGKQNSKITFAALVGFKTPEQGIDESRTLSECIPKEFISKIGPSACTLPPIPSWKNVIRIPVVNSHGKVIHLMKFKTMAKSTSWKDHCSRLGFLTDIYLAGNVQAMFPNVQSFFSVSLDHSIHFHQPLKIDTSNWIYFYEETTAVYNSCAHVIVKLFNFEEEHIATVTQELLLRKDSRI